jgi:inositol oxygenase
MWDEESEFDKDMDKSTFRDYDAACDRVRAFYKEQHGQLSLVYALYHC